MLSLCSEAFSARYEIVMLAGRKVGWTCQPRRLCPALLAVSSVADFWESSPCPVPPLFHQVEWKCVLVKLQNQSIPSSSNSWRSRSWIQVLEAQSTRSTSVSGWRRAQVRGLYLWREEWLQLSRGSVYPCLAFIFLLRLSGGISSRANVWVFAVQFHWMFLY